VRGTGHAFPTIRTQGGLFPPDFLQRLSEQKGVPGLETSAYHLTEPGERLRDAINRSWARLTTAWANFAALRARQRPDDPGTTITRARWLLVLFSELGYGQLQASKAVDHDGKNYPVSHFWNRTPIHLVGYGAPLDRRTPGQAGAARFSPHGLVQELLTRHDDYLWGFVSNGLSLRLLRDNAALTRLSYVEFDLEAMMEAGHVSDFAVLWLLCHQSRVEGERPEECWLERWAREAREQGQRALEQLRDGVERAIATLGAGFLSHPANAPLREALRAGALTGQDYYRQVLRLVYRLIFLFVAEDRDLLLPRDVGPEIRERYRRHYSTARLRGRAMRTRGTPHPDVYRSLRVVMEALGRDEGCPALGLPALGSFLWSSRAVEHLQACELSNRDVLAAVRALAVVDRGRVTTLVDWRNLGSEELGSVYESLLELHPRIDLQAATFELSGASGSERKTTGSYYTPDSLIQCLLDTALDPVLEEAASNADAERAILSLKVCDPACGSGHFLIAAAHRMAKRLAAVRTGDEEAAPEAVQTALRDVVGKCLYGVDLNEMAVELCKVSLWMEALEPGKPLSFLEHRILCGNSLLGTTPKLMDGGIPDAAFEVLEGDDKKVVRILKARNKRERTGLTALPLAAEVGPRFGSLGESWRHVEEIGDAAIGAVREKEALLERLLRSEDYVRDRLAADAWCAAFVMPKVGRAEHAVTEDVFRTLERRPRDVPEATRREVARVAGDYRFLHWHLAFPDVFRVPTGDGERAENEETGWSGGFDVVLGNPPWERIKLQEREWFAARRPDIANAPNAAARRRLIEALKHDDPALWDQWCAALRRADGESALVRQSGRYPLCGRGDVNTYAVFAELNRSLVSGRGRAGFIVPSGIATDDTTKVYFSSIVAHRSLVSLFEFENEGFFPGVGQGHMNRFCLLTLSGRAFPAPLKFLYHGRRIAELAIPDRIVSLDVEDFALLNPNTRTCPIFRSGRDAELTKAIYRRVPVLVDEARGESGNPWAIRFMAMLHMANDSGLFRTAAQLEAEGWTLRGNVFHRDAERCVPLYEAKMVYHFNHRHGSFRAVQPGDYGHVLPPVPIDDLRDSTSSAVPRYWVAPAEVEQRLRQRKWEREWLLGWRDVTDARASARTVIASVIPRVGVGHKFPLMILGSPLDGVQLCANLDSFVLDYAARQKLGGTSLTYFILRQLPVLAPLTFNAPAPWCSTHTAGAWLRPRVLELVYTAWDLEAFGRDVGWNGPPFRWDPDRRFLIRCELDAAFFHLYLGTADEWRGQPKSLTRALPTPRDAVAYIMDTFPIVRRNDEAAHGEYRTKRVILEIYDEMAEAIRTGQSYKTRLEPPPGDPRVAHPSRTHIDE
jgi:hypothetical protein